MAGNGGIQTPYFVNPPSWFPRVAQKCNEIEVSGGGGAPDVALLTCN